MKLWAMLGRATQAGLVMVKSSDKTWSTGEGNGKPFQCSCLENPMNSMKRQKDRTLKDELPRSVHEAINSIIWFNHKFHLDWRKSNILICSIVCIIISYIVGTELSDFQIRSDQLLSRVWLFATPWITARQASLSITNPQSSLRLMSIESVMPSAHLILCRPLLLLPPIPPSIRVFSNESTLHMRWPKYWNFSFSIIPSKEIP